MESFCEFMFWYMVLLFVGGGIIGHIIAGFVNRNVENAFLEGATTIVIVSIVWGIELFAVFGLQDAYCT